MESYKDRSNDCPLAMGTSMGLACGSCVCYQSSTQESASSRHELLLSPSGLVGKANTSDEETVRKDDILNQKPRVLESPAAEPEVPSCASLSKAADQPIAQEKGNETDTARSETASPSKEGTAAEMVPCDSVSNGTAGDGHGVDRPSQLGNGSMVSRRLSKASTTAFREGWRRLSTKVLKTRQYSNPNFPKDYLWLQEVLEPIVRNRARSLACVDTATGKGYDPVFFVVGACPNMFCGMQVVMYSVSREGERDVDFWWVKPSKTASVERKTLNRNGRGPHKNDPGRSKPVYKPLADLFINGETKDGMRFGIEQIEPQPGCPALRAFIEKASQSGVGKYYIHFVWQEEWTANPFSRSKYIKGKIVYQKDPSKVEFHGRQYSITDGQMEISEIEEDFYDAVVPGEEIKQLLD